MTLARPGEFEFIERIRAGCIVRPEGVVRGIGDDCAVTEGGEFLRLVTTDLMVDGVHFLRRAITPEQLGAKALAVNLSDIAAMGGEPLDAFVSIAAPADVSVQYLEGLYVGLKAMATRYRVNVLGGDTSSSPSDLVLNITLTGQVSPSEILYRDGARVGDLLFVTGVLGDSRGGLDAILQGRADASPVARELVRRHHEAEPHVLQGRAIARTGLAHAMIDVSDGLAADLARLCDGSGVGAEIDGEDLPVSEHLTQYCRTHGLAPRELAVAGGEDYVLLVAGDPTLATVLRGQGVPLHPIGRVVAGKGRDLVRADGTRAPMGREGWDHFGRAPRSQDHPARG